MSVVGHFYKWPPVDIKEIFIMKDACLNCCRIYGPCLEQLARAQHRNRLPHRVHVHGTRAYLHGTRAYQEVNVHT